MDEALFPAMRAHVMAISAENPNCAADLVHGLLEDAAIAMLEVERLETSLRFLYLAELVQPNKSYAGLIALLHHIRSVAPEVVRRGQALAHRYSDVEINQVGSIVWGATYLDAFMKYNVRSMLAEGNMPALRRHGIVVHSIVTTESGREYILGHPVYQQLARVAQVEFLCFPEALLDLFKGEHGPDKLSYLLYGILDHTNLFFARGLGGNLFLIPVDSVVASPSFASMRRYLEEGYDCCGAGNLVAEREQFLPALDRRYGDVGVIDIDTRTLASLAFEHGHHYVRSQLIHDGNQDFGRHPRELFWPVPGGIAAHSIYTHPLAISKRRLIRQFAMPYAWVDFLLPVRLFSDPAEFDRYKIIEDATEAYINNFAPASRTYATIAH